MKKYLLIFAVFALGFSACKKNNDTTTFDPAVQAKIDDDKIQAYIAANNITTAVKDQSGLYYQIITPGTGINPTASSTVRVAYTGKLLDGTQFDTQPNFSTAISANANIIEGWKVGIPFCKQGGRILLLIPSALGYANSPKSGIPANSVLVFTIDLFSFQG